MSFKDASLILECPKCETINYLDPFTFWNFKGKIKCAGCDAIWAYELENGHRKAPPAEAKAPHDKVPGFAGCSSRSARTTSTSCPSCAATADRQSPTWSRKRSFNETKRGKR